MTNNARTLLSLTWNQVVADYRNGLINSERALQAAWYYHLRNAIPASDVHRRILVEPPLAIGGRNTIPDLVLANYVPGDETGGINAVVEIKFKPHDYANWSQDLAKLQEIGRAESGGPMLIESSTGKWIRLDPKIDSPVVLKTSSNTVLCFAVICRHDAEAVDTPTLERQIKASGQPGRFVHLFERTGLGEQG